MMRPQRNSGTCSGEFVMSTPTGPLAGLLRDRTGRATLALIIFFAAAATILWFAGSGTFFVKKATESHNILLVAANVRDLLSYLVQDVATSPDPAAHPFWYIHHPNLLAKTFSLLFTRLGFGLEGQTAFLLTINTLALTLVAAAFRTISAPAALGALLTAVTSYAGFYFNAADLCRGPLYLIVWFLLLALVRNRGLVSRGWSAVTAATIVAATLSDWGLAVFTVAFACCMATLGRGAVPWRWVAGWVVAPAVGALIFYEAAVVAAVGWQFFLLDLKITYLGRMGAGVFVDYRDLLQAYRDNAVVIWPAHGRGTETLFDLAAVLSVTPLLNTGPAWLLLMPLALWALGRTLVKERLGRVAWAIIGIVTIVSTLGLVPLAILGIPLIIVGLALAQLPMTTPMQRLTGLLTSALLGIITAAAIFPSFTMGFTIAAGHPPFPLIEMSATALLAELVISGTLVRFFEHRARRSTNWNELRTVQAAILIALIGIVALTSAKIAAGSQTLFGLPTFIGLALAVLLIGGPSVAFLNAQYFAPAAKGDAGGRVIFGRSLWAVLLAAAAVLFSYHMSANPTLFGWYSVQFAAFLAILLGCALVALIMAIWPAVANIAWNTLIRAANVFSPASWRTRIAAQVVGAIGVLLVASQAGWLTVSAITHPPKPIPYAKVLEQPQYRGHSFLTTSEGAIVWYSTRGWTYLSPSNPPPPGPLSPRFRHFADWRNDAKYGVPEFFLCDNTGYGYVRAGTQVDSDVPAELSCEGATCTCHDVARDLARRGHVVEADHDNFAIIRFRWPQMPR
jgi:hypothetical protein